jgi:hypothetical protein
MADPNTILKIAFQYSDTFKEKEEAKALIANASSRYLLVQTEHSEPKKPAPPAADFNEPNTQLIEAYKNEIIRLKEADSEERADLYDRARELGIEIIAGEK